MALAKRSKTSISNWLFWKSDQSDCWYNTEYPESIRDTSLYIWTIFVLCYFIWKFLALNIEKINRKHCSIALNSLVYVLKFAVVECAHGLCSPHDIIPQMCCLLHHHNQFLRIGSKLSLVYGFNILFAAGYRRISKMDLLWVKLYYI